MFTISFGLPIAGWFYLGFGLVYDRITEAIQFLVVTEVREVTWWHGNFITIECLNLFHVHNDVDFKLQGLDFSILSNLEALQKTKEPSNS